MALRSKWGPFGPTLAVTPENALKAKDAIRARSSDWLRNLGVRWFDWGWEEWRDDHEVWVDCLRKDGRVDRKKEEQWRKRSV